MFQYKLMFGMLKDYFFPHEKNGHEPHILRSRLIVLILLAAMIVEGLVLVQSSPVAPHAGFLGNIVSSLLISETNSNRAQMYLGQLKENPVLDAAAKAKAQDMASKSYFAHTSPEGLTPWYWFDKYGYNFSYAGENLAVDFTDTDAVTRAWMNSPLHRANILDGHFTEIGIGIAEGTLNGRKTTFVVQLFGKPARSQAKIVPIASRSDTPVKSEPSQEVFALAATSEATTAASSAPPAVAGESAENLTDTKVVVAAVPNIQPEIANILFTILSLLLSAALFIKIARAGMLHPHQIRNGILALMIFASLVAVNYFFLQSLQTRIF